MRTSIQYLFCASPGRAGTAYLSTLLAQVEGCVSVHEPDPVGNGRPMRQFLRGKPRAMQALTFRKKGIIEALRGTQLYAETNHCFIKGFGWLLPTMLNPAEMGLVILERDREQIVSSYLGREHLPLSGTGRNWFIPGDKQAPILPPPSLGGTTPAFTYRLYRVAYRISRTLSAVGIQFKNLSAWIMQYQHDALRWYVDETYAMAEDYAHRFPTIRIFRTNLEQLNTESGVQVLLDFFGLKAKSGMTLVIGKPVNQS